MRFPLQTLYACLLLAAAGDLQRLTSGRRKSRELTQDEICRQEPHFVCQDEKCVPVANARCDGVIQCEDGSDEQNCTRRSGCILPQYPTGGNFQLAGCTGNSCNGVPGSIVPSGSYLTYNCGQGYTRIGRSVISYCHVNAWQQLPSCVKMCPALRYDNVNIVYKYHGREVRSPRETVPGTKAILQCEDSYKIPLGNHSGYEVVTCREDGVWDRAVFNCIPVCGTVTPRANPTIVNGSRAEYGDFPWHVGIYRKGRSENFDQICGGTLVSPNLVISAAHCFYDDNFRTLMNASNYMVVSGKFYRHYKMPDRYAQISALKRIEKHERYLGSIANYANDIALLHLATRFSMTPFVRPICMDWDNGFEKEQLQNGTIGKVMGWGMNAAGNYSFELQTINLPYVDFLTCSNNAQDDFVQILTNDKFCAGYLNGSSVCTGDSGGGLCFKHGRLWYLRGIVSIGPRVQNTICHDYSTFTNVGTFLGWIRRVVFGSSNLPGEETGASEYATTLAPFNGRITTAIATLSGCILPEQPTHGSFELSPCVRPCNVAAGTRVPNSSFLTYRCNEGYALNGNNTVTVCMNDVWYPPSACLKKVPGNHCPALKSKSKSVVCKYRDEIVPCGFEMPSGTRASLACESRHVIPSLEDPQYTSEIICFDNGTWDHPGIECTYECGTRVPDGTQFVVNGSRVQHGIFPWRVNIYKKNSQSFFSSIGIGTLISPGLVMTKDLYSRGDVAASDYAIGAGQPESFNTRGAYVQKSLVQSVHRTEQKYHIALLRLQTPVTMTALVRPICIDWENRVVTDAIQSRATDETGNTINRPYIPHGKCLSKLKTKYKRYLSADMFCTNRIPTGSQAGYTSDHGFTFGYLSHGIWYLLGIYRNSKDTITGVAMDMFTEVVLHLDWIRAAHNVTVA